MTTRDDIRRATSVTSRRRRSRRPPGLAVAVPVRLPPGPGWPVADDTHADIREGPTRTRRAPTRHTGRLRAPRDGRRSTPVRREPPVRPRAGASRTSVVLHHGLAGPAERLASS